MLYPLIAGLVLMPATQVPYAPTIAYEQPGQATTSARDLLKDSGALNGLPRVKQRITIVARDCGTPTTTWDQARRRITICYELVGSVRKTMNGISETEEADPRAARARVDGALTALVRHQLGHALAGLNGLDDSEQLADEFAALTLSGAKPGAAVATAEARSLLAAHQGPAHLKDPAAATTFTCLLYGAAPEARHRIARGGWIPTGRAPSCAKEYAQARASLSSLI